MLSPLEPPAFLTVDQVAAVLLVSPHSVYGRISRGELDVVRVGTGPIAPIRIAPADLVGYF